MSGAPSKVAGNFLALLAGNVTGSVMDDAIENLLKELYKISGKAQEESDKGAPPDHEQYIKMEIEYVHSYEKIEYKIVATDVKGKKIIHRTGVINMPKDKN